MRPANALKVDQIFGDWFPRCCRVTYRGSAAALLRVRRAPVDVNVIPARFFEDAGGGQLAVGILAANPQKRRAGLERRLEIRAVARCRVIVEQLLQGGAAEAGSHQGGDDGGDRAARQHDDPGHRQRSDVLDLVADARGYDGTLTATRLAGGSERIV